MTSKSVFDVIGADVKIEFFHSDIAIVPFGSIEYHGPHAPLGTDSLIAQELGRRVSSRLNSILYPLIAYTTCPVMTKRNPGTVTIDADVMTSYIEDIFRSLFNHGVKGIFALNAHDGNINTIRRAAERIYFDYPNQYILTINWWQTVPTTKVNELGLFTNEGGHGHGGPLETSAAWASQTHPGTVDSSRAKDIDVSFDNQSILSVLIYGNGKNTPDWAGYHGRVSESSFEKGEVLLQLAEDKIVNLIQDWIRAFKGE